MSNGRSMVHPERTALILKTPCRPRFQPGCVPSELLCQPNEEPVRNTGCRLELNSPNLPERDHYSGGDIQAEIFDEDIQAETGLVTRAANHAKHANALDSRSRFVFIRVNSRVEISPRGRIFLRT
jgi:hypothetical protein